jgi:replicative DNA helicase
VTAAVPPQNLDAEESVLGAMLLSPRAIDAVSEVTTPADFYRGSHGLIYKTALDLYAAGTPVDAITLSDELERRGELEEVGGRSRINELAALVPASSNARHYARIVREMAILRGLVRAGSEIVRLGFERGGATVEEVVEQAEGLLFDLAQGSQPSDFDRVGPAVRDAYDEMVALKESGTDLTGTPSGFLDLDRLTAGFQRGNLIVVAARPSMGKSAFVLGTCAHLAVGLGVPVGLFTMEMSRREVAQRLISMEARVETQRIRNGRVADEDWPRIIHAADRIDRAPLYVDDAGAPTMLEVRSKARRLKAREPGLGLIAVDYLQLMTGDAENRVQEVSKISRALKVLAGDLDVPVIALSQLSRQVEQRHDKRPILSDLRESGSIEQDADLVMFIYRDEYYHPEEVDQAGVAEVNLSKQRNGPTGTVKMAFAKRFARFSDLHTHPGAQGAPAA